jgi:adenylate cyclase
VESPSPDALNQAALPHKLAAILYADVEGYSRLTGADEVGTHRTLSSYLDLFTETIKAHHGEVKHYAGDAVLADFTTVSDALKCAVSVQQAIKEKNQTIPDDKRVQFRIGLNLGEVIVDRGEVYGNGVNVAARLETLAEPGGICISGAARDAIGNKLQFVYEYLGEHRVKNIDEPVRAYRVNFTGEPSTIKQVTPEVRNRKQSPTRIGAIALAGVAVVGIGIWQFGAKHSPDSAQVTDAVLAMPTGPAIAVLPFTNMSADPKEDYFSDGITEQIISELARFRGLYVVARNSTFQYKGRALDVREVGRELGARYVLEGSVRRSKETLRVTVQLLDAHSGAHLWAETYDRALTGTDIFALQDDIASKVVANIAGSHGHISQARLEDTHRKAPESIDSYDCVLRAAAYHKLLSPEGHGPIGDCLVRAVARDPNYGEAWGWLAVFYENEYEFGYKPRPEMYNALDRALEAGQRAVALDPNNALVHSNLARVRFMRHEVNASFASGERALALNPNDPEVLCNVGQFMVLAGNRERGVALTKKAIALGPNYPPWCHFQLSFAYYRKGEYQQALAETLKIDMPDLFFTHIYLAMNYGQLGRRDDARTAVAKLLELYPSIARDFRREARKSNISEDDIEHQADGLRKAGLNIPPEVK